MSDHDDSSAATRVLLKAVLNIALVWVLASYLPQFFALSGGWWGVVVVGALVTLLNLLVRPLLHLITLPFKLFAYILALVIVNGAFVFLIQWVAQFFDARVVSLQIGGGLVGWVVVAVILGLGNWIMKEILK